MTEEMPMPEPEEIEALMAESPDAPATIVEEGPMATGDDPLVDTIVNGEVVVAQPEPPPPQAETLIVDSAGVAEMVKVDENGMNGAVLKKDIEATNLEVRRPSTPLEISAEEYAEIYNAQIKDLASVMKAKFVEHGPELGRLEAADVISKQIHGLLKLISVSKIQWHAAQRTFGNLLKELDESNTKKYRAQAEGPKRARPETVRAKSESTRKRTPKDPHLAALQAMMDMGYSEADAQAMLANVKKIEPKDGGK